MLEGYTTPLIVASVDYVFSLFRQSSGYKNIYPKPILGNYDNADVLTIHEKACEILQPYFNNKRNKQKEKFTSNIGKTTTTINEIITSAPIGGIETLFVKKHQNVWGKIEQGTEPVMLHHKRMPMDICLLDYTARNTFLKGGKVFLEDPSGLPEPDAVANAILRH